MLVDIQIPLLQHLWLSQSPEPAEFFIGLEFQFAATAEVRLPHRRGRHQEVNALTDVVGVAIRTLTSNSARLSRRPVHAADLSARSSPSRHDPRTA